MSGLSPGGSRAAHDHTWNRIDDGLECTTIVCVPYEYDTTMETYGGLVFG